MKKYASGLTAVSLALCLVSFTHRARHENSPLTAEWFHFTGDASDPDQLADPFYYVRQSPVCNSTTLEYRCDILIEPQLADPDRPDLTKPVQLELQRADPN